MSQHGAQALWGRETLAGMADGGLAAYGMPVGGAARLADALAALHEKGFLHGDVKPSNIGFTSEGSPKLLDFGLAHAVDDAAMVGGTLPYLSPEALTGRTAEEADDVWSLSVVLYEMVSGRHPFAGGALEEVQRRIRRADIGGGRGRLRGIDPDGPPASARGGRGPRERLVKLFATFLSGSLLPYVLGIYREVVCGLLP